MYAEHIAAEQNMDVLDQTFGAWEREDSAAASVSSARKTFRDAMTRRRK